MTGIYGAFDPEKVAREWRAGFHGVEISCLRSQKDADLAFSFARDCEMGAGVHFPLVRDSHPAVGLHPPLTSNDARERRAGFDAIARELEMADRYGARYLVVHYPKPAILKAGADWSDWRFVSDREAIDERATSLSQQEDLSYAAFETLTEIARGSGVRVVIEHDILCPLHYGTAGGQGLLFRLLKSHPSLGFCVDLGRLHLQEVIDSGFDAVKLLKRALTYVTNVHVWTVKAGTNKLGGHIPVHPDLRKEDGWGDIDGFLRTLSALDTGYVMFEHRADLVTPERLDETYAWIASMLAGDRPTGDR